METTEIRVSDFSEQLPVIDVNFDEVYKWLSDNVSGYRTMVVTEDSIPAAKSDRAKLNKLAKSISDQRVTVKKAYIKPYEDFDAKMRSLSKLCEDASENIDSQIKEYEVKAKERKSREIYEYFAKTEAPEWLSLERIWNSKWLNASYDMSSVMGDIENRITEVCEDVKSIEALHTPFENEVLLEYQKTLNLREAFNKNTILLKMKEAQEERIRIKKEQEKLQAERDAQRKAEADRRNAELEAKNAEKTEQEELAKSIQDILDGKQEEPKIVTIDFRVQCTNEQLLLLKSFLNNNNIKYGRVPTNN